MIDPLAPFRLEGRVAIVTGASSGLGARFGRVLHAAGACVVLAARREQPLEDLARELTGAVSVACDVTREEERRRLVDAACQRFGRIDVLLNNAGVHMSLPALEEPVAGFARVIDVNLVAPFALAQLVARRMLEQNSGGSIVNVASVYAIVGSGRPPLASYVASKSGVAGLTRELAGQWAEHGIRVNALAPGYFRSEMTAGMLDDPQGAAFVQRRTLLGRPGEAHELDGSLLFLASDASSYVTGQVLAVDGGWTAV